MKVEAREVARRMEHFKAAVKVAGVKLTHQRLEIFREVASSLEHPDAEAVFRAVQPRMPTVSLDTVYRTLWLLTEFGLVSTLSPRRERVRFDANLHHHHHFVCMRCGLTRDFDSAELDSVHVQNAVKQHGSVVATHVEVCGVCKNCAKEIAEGSAHQQQKKPQGKRGRT
jgi:Fur family peroxide stress response transcriptional regulator